MSRAACMAFAAINGACVGVVAGLTLFVGYHCAVGWVAGGSADPRCAVGVRGFVEVHLLASQRALDRVRCEYRPGLVLP